MSDELELRLLALGGALDVPPAPATTRPAAARRPAGWWPSQ